MKERPLIVFTLLAQMAVGAYWTLGTLAVWSTWRAGRGVADALTAFGWSAVGPIMAAGMAASLLHLGAPANSWRAFGNLRQSWLSREILLAAAFAGGSTLFAGLHWLDMGSGAVRGSVGVTTGLAGLALVGSMGNVYRLRTVPAWNSWITPTSFFVTTFLLGALAVGAILIIQSTPPAEWTRLALQGIALWSVVLMGLDLGVAALWMAQLSGSEAASNSAVRVARKRGILFTLRLALAVGGITAAGVALLDPCEGCAPAQEFALFVALGCVLASQAVGRALFYEARGRYGV